MSSNAMGLEFRPENIPKHVSKTYECPNVTIGLEFHPENISKDVTKATLIHALHFDQTCHISLALQVCCLADRAENIPSQA